MSSHGLIGVDEVGRGSWAGPLLVVAARAKSELPKGLKDSKLLSKKQRAALKEQLMVCCEFGEGWVSASEIDGIGLGAAMKLAGARSLEGLRAAASEPIILDGSYNYLPKGFIDVKYFPKADNLEPLVSAASIYAKETRDTYMFDLARKYPGYFFDKHVGYGTKSHAEALKLLKAIAGVHRYSFKPIAAVTRGEV